MIFIKTLRLCIFFACGLWACSRPVKGAAIPAALLPASILQPQGDAERNLRVRVYVGPDFRARVIDWDAELKQVLLASSSILRSGTGIGLEIVDTPLWKRSGNDITRMFDTLKSLDAGLDVDLVLGLVDGHSEALQDFSSLFLTELLGRHVLVRNFSYRAESDSLGDAAKNLSEEDREILLNRRRRHKQAVLIAHSIAVNFGVVAGPEQFVDGSEYRLQQTEMSPRAQKLLRLTIPVRLSSKDIEGMESTLAGLMGLQVRESLLQKVRESIAAGEKKAVVMVETLRDVDRKTLHRVQVLLEKRQGDSAWEVLEPLVEHYPQDPSVADMACLASHMRRATDALSHCDVALRLTPDNHKTLLAMGQLQIPSSPDAALVHLTRASQKLPEGDRGWSVLAHAYQKLSLPSLAAKVAQKEKLPDVLKWAEQTRMRYGTDVGIPVTDEGRYLVGLKAALALVYKKDYSKARKAAESMKERFPESIAGPLIACEIASRRRDYDGALQICTEVLRLHKENAWARYLLGISYHRKKQNKEAIAMLNLAIRSDPELKAAYKALAGLYKLAENDGHLETLNLQYRQQFGQSLPD